MQKRVIANNLLFDQVTELVAQAVQVEIPTKGSSMLPFIVGGRDTLILSQVTDLRVGDIVLAKLSGERYVVHRIIKIEDSVVTLMGDGNIRGCEYCSTLEVCATVIRIVSKGSSIDCRGARAQRLARLWRMLLPVRRYLLFLLRPIL